MSGFAPVLVAILVSSAPATVGSDGSQEPPEERASGSGAISIRRAPPDAEARQRLQHLRSWSRLFQRETLSVREAATELFRALESSSLASQARLCRKIHSAARSADRVQLLPSPEVRIDRVLVGALERYRAGAEECLVERYLLAFSLFEEARAGLAWIDRHLERRFRPRTRLPGLEEQG